MLPEANIVVQPQNRGTAAGILLPLLSILARDPEAKLIVLPSDHFVADEELLGDAILQAFEAIERQPGNEAASLGFRVIQCTDQGAGLALLLERTPESGPALKYQLLSTSKVVTMKKELQEYSRQGYRLLPRSIIGIQRPLILGGPF